MHAEMAKLPEPSSIRDVAKVQLFTPTDVFIRSHTKLTQPLIQIEWPLTPTGDIELVAGDPRMYETKADGAAFSESR